eukprot:Gregarina_sp_Poly_1__665@NODE_1159_length_4905_cov_618_352625_g795_i0_p3_GENE_NODE_1159_length_4905_cov_618_352625_g795_i0NODE_1159_length_4905_cov_618_352625_g795_i0_p3_ORF_typecomplete_len172_score15_48_NODE_1159_length_4905_cov_618_352625_g795_i021272642
MISALIFAHLAPFVHNRHSSFSASNNCLRGVNELDFPIMISPLKSSQACQVLGQWELNKNTWPALPHASVTPTLNIKFGDGAYHIESVAINTYLVETESYDSEICPESIYTSSLRMTTFNLPEKDIVPEVLWYSVLENIRHLLPSEDGAHLSVAFGDDLKLRRIEFSSVNV